MSLPNVGSVSVVLLKDRKVKKDERKRLLRGVQKKRLLRAHGFVRLFNWSRGASSRPACMPAVEVGAADRCEHLTGRAAAMHSSTAQQHCPRLVGRLRVQRALQLLQTDFGCIAEQLVVEPLDS